MYPFIWSDGSEGRSLERYRLALYTKHINLVMPCSVGIYAYGFEKPSAIQQRAVKVRLLHFALHICINVNMYFCSRWLPEWMSSLRRSQVLLFKALLLYVCMYVCIGIYDRNENFKIPSFESVCVRCWNLNRLTDQASSVRRYMACLCVWYECFVLLVKFVSFVTLPLYLCAIVVQERGRLLLLPSEYYNSLIFLSGMRILISVTATM